MLLLTFPELKHDPELVAERLRTAGVGEKVMTIWEELAATEIQAADEDDEF
jgi:precorrin-6B methylase 1